MKCLYRISPASRTFFLWLGFQLVLWITFFVSFVAHQEAWQNVPLVPSGFGAEGGFMATLFFILGRNLFICLLIIVGNVFLRFGWFTPGLGILLLQGISIGWMAGSNGFEVPFASVTAAHMQYLRIGLWETTAYAIACGATLTRSLLVANTFPAKTWDEQREIRDIRFDSGEKTLLLAGSLVLLVAASIEAWFLVG